MRLDSPAPHYTDTTYAVACQGTIPLGPAASPPVATVTATSPQTLVLETVTAVDQSGSAGFESCQGTAPGDMLPFDGSGEAAVSPALSRPGFRTS